mmetsp:Transcript_68211/g.188929  ORF Transcript_68211/g.188929 Transcript_68211/m.188929 type:complete len:304 (-) Transcript_68211:293-1204(-)
MAVRARNVRAKWCPRARQRRAGWGRPAGPSTHDTPQTVGERGGIAREPAGRLLLVALGLLGDAPALDQPHLVTDLLDELLRVRDHDDAALVPGEALDQRVQRLHVDVIRGLVEGDDVRLRPEGRAQGELGLLPGGEAADLAVQDHVLVEAELLEVLDDLLLAQGPLVHPDGLRGLPLVEGLREGRHAHHLELGHGLERVLLLIREVRPLHLVQHLVSPNHAADDVPDLVAVLAVPVRQVLPHLGLLLVRRLKQSPLQSLVPPMLVPLLDVHVWRAVQELGQVEHVLLRDVCQAQVSVLGDLPR